jgi:hypothetical protein
MNAIAIFLLFVGTVLLLQGYYDNTHTCPPPKVEIKYIPLTLYEEQLSPEQSVSNQFRSMFEATNPWPTVRG